MKAMVLLHKDLVPPEQYTNKEIEGADWKTEYRWKRILYWSFGK